MAEETVNKMPELPPLTLDQAKLEILSRAPQGSLFFIPFGQMLEPALKHVAFERLLIAGHLKLVDVNVQAIPGPNGRPANMFVRYFGVTESGMRELATLRGTVSLDS